MSTVPSVAQIIKLLQSEYHADRGHWILVPELRIGNDAGVERAIDLWALHYHPSKGHKSISYEIKRSRGDFLRDLKKAETKHQGARAYSDEFYYVAPEGMVMAGELPLWAGLIELRTRPGMNWLPIMASKPLQTPRMGPSWGLIVSLLRRSGRITGG